MSKLKNYRLFTSESVSEGHADKICDQISDAVLDACLKGDPNSRVACECFFSARKLIISGEIRTNAKINYKNIAKKVLEDIGYNKQFLGISIENLEIDVIVNHQSNEIFEAVGDSGAGDQGIMFGYASNETANYMPLAIELANALIKRASFLRKNKKFKWAGPDMKSQVTIEFNPENTLDTKIYEMLMSIQHIQDIDMIEFKNYVKKEIMHYVADKYNLNKDFNILINPAGPFTIGGPKSDTGLTGRKIIVDTYGGFARHGGGCFSGKDGTKVDRTASYMCRYAAKNIVASGLADKCEIQVSYAISQKEPISLYIDSFNTCHVKGGDEELLSILKKHFKFNPKDMIKILEMQIPIFYKTATYGHFGRDDLRLPWEKLDKVEELKQYITTK